MAGLTEKQIRLLRAITDWTGLPEQIRLLARSVAEEDKTYKNSRLTKGFLKKLEVPSFQSLPLSPKNKNLFIEDVSDFIEERYYLSPREKEVFEHIQKIRNASERLSALNLRYLNSTLLYGESGTGKTTFGRYIAYKFNLPFVYLNLSQTVGSLLGETSANISSVFTDIKEFPCVLMLDEIDSIAEKRCGGDGASGKEHNRMVITLMQELDRISPSNVIIGATNRLDILDPALVRRFSLKHEVVRLTKEELLTLGRMFLSDVGVDVKEDVINSLVDNCQYASQSFFVNGLIEEIVNVVLDNPEGLLLE